MRRALVAAVALMLLIVPALASAAGPNARWADQRAPSARVGASEQRADDGRGPALRERSDPGARGRRDQGPRGRRPGLPGGRAARGRKRGERTRVRRASGILLRLGSRVTVTVIGRELSFSIAGHGRALFAGSGVYRLDSETEAEWSENGCASPPSSSPERRRARRCANCSSSAARSAPVALPAVALAQTDEPVGDGSGRRGGRRQDDRQGAPTRGTGGFRYEGSGGVTIVGDGIVRVVDLSATKDLVKTATGFGSTKASKDGLGPATTARAP